MIDITKGKKQFEIKILHLSKTSKTTYKNIKELRQSSNCRIARFTSGNQSR
jgi:hypothetical protein